MRKTVHPVIAFILLGGLLLLGGCKGGRRSAAPSGPPKSDIEFAREVFRLLAEGDESVASMIDWENLQAPGIADVGAKYREAEADDAAERFENAFIHSYADAFKKRGGRVENFSNWREQSRDAERTVVAADVQVGKLLLITVTHAGGQQKVSAFELR